jgi:hypothetical protein
MTISAGTVRTATADNQTIADSPRLPSSTNRSPNRVTARPAGTDPASRPSPSIPPTRAAVPGSAPSWSAEKVSTTVAAPSPPWASADGTSTGSASDRQTEKPISLTVRRLTLTSSILISRHAVGG